MKKKMSSLLLIGLMLISTLVPTLVQAEDINQANLPVKVRQTLSVDPIVDDELFDEVIDLYTDKGWIYNQELNQLERIIDVTENEDIEFLVENIEDRNIVKVSEDLSVLNIQQSSRENIDNEIIIYDLPIDGMFDDGEEQIPKLQYEPKASTTNPYWEDGERGVTGYLVHCNRFNGPYGDYRYYSKSNAQAYTNFVESDCDFGFVASGFKCVKDYIPGLSNYCAAYPASKQGSCSSDIGHSRKFHFHY